MQEEIQEVMQDVLSEIEAPEETAKPVPDIEQRLEDISETIHRQLCVKDDLINKLHSELEYYKKDSAGKFEDQLLKAVIKVRHNMKQRLGNPDFAGFPAERLLDEYRYIFEDLTDLLEQQN